VSEPDSEPTLPRAPAVLPDVGEHPALPTAPAVLPVVPPEEEPHPEVAAMPWPRSSR
jgi:hypothetical protein